MYKPQTDKWHDRDNNPMDVDSPKRLSEPAEDEPDFKTHGIERGRYASGGYVKPEPPLTEPKDYADPKFGSRIELDAAAVQNLAQSILNQKSYLQ